jgi:signal transduction histidine kinase
VIDVAAVASAVARLSEPTATARGVAIRVVPPVDGARVRGNDADLQHILLNLILNAIEASAPGGEVRLAVDGRDPVRIRVSDDGPGITPEDQARIFEPFCSLRPEGTGLGLFLAQSFARRWGGDIRVTSAPGVGSTFELVWPTSHAAGAVAGAALAPSVQVPS